jgi:hypothetical protein
LTEKLAKEHATGIFFYSDSFGHPRPLFSQFSPPGASLCRITAAKIRLRIFSLINICKGSFS